MFSLFFSTALLYVNLTIVVFLCILLLGIFVSLKVNNCSAVKFFKIGLNCLLAFFGIFKCQDNKEYCYLGFKITGWGFALALLLEFGIILLSAHIAITFLLLHVGVSAWQTIASPIIGYLIYPIMMSCLRKKCS